MKKIVAILMAMLMVMSVTVALADSVADKDTQPKVPVIVGFKDTPSQVDKDMIRGHGGDVKHSYTIINAIAAKLPEQAIDKIKKNPKVAYVEVDGEVHALDTELDNSWGVKRIGAGTVHAYNKGTGVKVAIIDTGIDYTHEDLAGNFGSTLLGYDFVNSDNDPMDDNGHGTHCAGIVAAEDNDVGVVGVAPEANLYAVKVLNNEGSGWVSDVIAGIDWSVENGMQVISMSLGSDFGSQSLKKACNNAYKSGVLVVAAAGNDGNPLGIGNSVDYPARYDSVIAVAATDSNNNRASFSSTGPDVELAAPGVNIYSTVLEGGYGTKNGTSMACPHVAGTAALVMAAYPDWTNEQVRQQLWNTAEDLGATGFDTKYGHGLADADEAAPPPVGNQAPVADAGPGQDVKTGSTVQLDGTGSYDPDGNPITYSWDFVSKPTGSTATLNGADTATPTFVADVNGTYEVELTVSDGELSSTATVVITAATAPSEPTIVSVDSIIYHTEGGRYQNLHLLITVALVDDLGNPVADASVSIDVYRDGSYYGSGTGTTGTDGTVTFKANNAPSGTYSTTVTDITAEGLTWDGVTPGNSFDK